MMTDLFSAYLVPFVVGLLALLFHRQLARRFVADYRLNPSYAIHRRLFGIRTERSTRLDYKLGGATLMGVGLTGMAAERHLPRPIVIALGAITGALFIVTFITAFFGYRRE